MPLLSTLIITLVSIFLFIFGSVIGSFLLVLIDRLPRGEDIFISRSRCEFCNHVLTPRELIPLLSFVFQRGKCLHCHTFFGWRYFLIELLTGVAFAGISLYVLLLAPSSYIYVTPLLLLAISSLIVIFFADFWSGIIPDAAVVGLLISGLGLSFLYGDLLMSLFVGVISLLSFLIIFLATKGRGMGFGDVKYVGAMGVFLGWPNQLVGLYIAFLTGGIVSLILIIARRKKLLGSTIAFGPFLVFGTIIGVLFGTMMWQWYISRL